MSAAPGPIGPRERLRFIDFDFERLPNGRCRAAVGLAWHDGAHFDGTDEGYGSEAGELRCAATATLNAIEAAVENLVSFELLGVKSVRAFDTIVLIVSVVSKSGEETHRLVGSFLADDDSTRGAAVAVLSATNRLLGNIFRREPR